VILVLGGNGQLGQELARSAALQSIPLTALSRHQLDIGERSAVTTALTHLKPMLVVNAAAYTKVDLAETNVEDARAANEVGPAVLAGACADAHLPLVHISTDYVFDGTKNAPYLETDMVCPLGVYGRTKAAGEQAVREILNRHVILRTSWVYSEFGHNFLKTILRLASSRDELRIVADQYGSPTSAREIAEAILLIAPRLWGIAELSGTYHLTAEGVTTWHGFASRAVAIQSALTGRSPHVVPIKTVDYPTAARRPLNSRLDCQLFGRTFGYRGRHWTEGVDITTRALLQHSQETAHVT
jgi:dTDP-4-dehydrorhamnose reductase